MRGQQLSPYDTAIWHTVSINEHIDAGRFHEVPTHPTMFPPTLGHGEHVVASGPFELRDCVAAGDGSYVHDSSTVVATGRFGLALTLGHLAGRAAGNAARRQAAREAAVARWRPISHGQVYVSDYGFYMHDSAGLHPWSWGALTSAQLVGERMLLFTGSSSRGPVQWILVSDWAELAFTLWARACHPQHPQLLAGTWVPAGWPERLARCSQEPPPSLSGRWAALMLPAAAEDRR